MTGEEQAAYIERKYQEALADERRLAALEGDDMKYARVRLAICPHHGTASAAKRYREMLAPAELAKIEAMPCPLNPDHKGRWDE